MNLMKVKSEDDGCNWL